MLRRLQQATKWFWHRQRLLALALLWFTFIFAPTCCILTCHLLFQHHLPTGQIHHAGATSTAAVHPLVVTDMPDRVDSTTKPADHQHNHTGGMPLFPRILYDVLFLLMLSIFCCILLHALAQPRIPWWPLPAPAPLTPPPR